MRTVLFLAKLLVSVALIVLVVRSFEVRGLIARLLSVDPGVMALAICLMFAAVPLQAMRWRAVLQSSGHHLPFSRKLAIVLIGNFFSQVLPSSIGGDAARIWCACRAGLAPGDAASTVVLDRLVSLLGLLVLSLCGLPWLLALVPDAAARSAIVLVIVSGLAGLVAVLALARLPGAWPVVRALAGFSERARRLALSRQLAGALAASVAAMVIFVCVVFYLARSLGAAAGFADCLLLVPPVLLVSAVPVSVAGWGVREGAMVMALGFAGVEPATALGVSILFGVSIAAASLPGAILWLSSGESVKNLERAAALARETGR